MIIALSVLFWFISQHPLLTFFAAMVLAGLALYGISMALVLRATLGQIPWDVLHVGVAQHLPVTFGTGS